MIEEVGGDAARIVPVFAPAEETVFVERSFPCVPEKGLPINRLLVGLFVGVNLVVIPLADRRIARVARAGPERLADQAALNHFARFPVLNVGQMLAADLKLQARRFDSTGENARLLEGLSHRLF